MQRAEAIAEVIFDEWEREGGMNKGRLIEILRRELAAMSPQPQMTYVFPAEALDADSVEELEFQFGIFTLDESQ